MREKKNSGFGITKTKVRNGYTQTILSAIYIMFLVVFVIGCEKNQQTDPSISDPLKAAGISEIVPGNLADSVPIDPIISVVFKDGTNSAKVLTTSITLKRGSETISGTVMYSGTTASFSSDIDLAPESDYTATVKTARSEDSNDSNSNEYSWHFKTGNHHRDNGLAVVSVFPLKSTTEVPVNTSLSVTFNQNLTYSMKKSVSVMLKMGTSIVTGIVSYSGKTATFKPDKSLTANTVYSGIIIIGSNNSGDNDKSGNYYTWSFTTAGSGTDVTAPTVLSVTPVNNATSVMATTTATVTFSEAMNSSTITSSTFTLKQGSTAVAGTVTYSGTTATFTPSAALADGTVYTGTITTGAKDAAGNSLASNYTWSFTTAVTAPAGKSFSADVVPILNLCNTCHTHPWTTSTVASTFYNNLVNGGFVKPATPASSGIYIKLNGGHPGGSTVSAAQVTTILTWLTEGSKNN